MKGWSAIVAKAEGKGVVTCDNGQRADVALAITGGGLTFGKTEVDDGKGVFSKVADISEIFGPYGQGEASAAAVESVSAQALTKGNVSVALTTKGRGWSLGVSGSKFSDRTRKGEVISSAVGVLAPAERALHADLLGDALRRAPNRGRSGLGVTAAEYPHTHPGTLRLQLLSAPRSLESGARSQTPASRQRTRTRQSCPAPTCS